MAKSSRLFSLRAVVSMLLVVVVAPLIPMIISGDWTWLEGWLYAVVSILAFAVSRLLVNRKHPDLIAERARYMDAPDTKPWDKMLSPLVGLGSILILVAAGLDRSYGWSAGFSTWVNMLALVLLVFGYAFSSWALVENRFFSGTVRIQTERGHHVVTTGPYRIVRHPGYAGGLLGFIFIPLLLDSWVAFIPAILLGVLMIIRTSLEDKALQAELPGYKEFAGKTRYRLIPGVW